MPILRNVIKLIATAKSLSDIICATDLIECADSSCSLECTAVRIEPCNSLKDAELHLGDGGLLIVSEKILYALDKFSRLRAGERLVDYSTERNAGKVIAIKFGLERRRVNPLRGKDLKRKGIAYANLQEVREFARDSC